MKPNQLIEEVLNGADPYRLVESVVHESSMTLEKLTSMIHQLDKDIASGKANLSDSIEVVEGAFEELGMESGIFKLSGQHRWKEFVDWAKDPYHKTRGALDKWVSHIKPHVVKHGVVKVEKKGGDRYQRVFVEFLHGGRMAVLFVDMLTGFAYKADGWNDWGDKLDAPFGKDFNDYVASIASDLESPADKAKGSKPEKLSSSVRKKLNDGLYDICKEPRTGVPLSDISTLFDKNGVVLLQEDNTEYSGFFTGSSGKANIDLAPKSSKYTARGSEFYVPYSNTMLVLTWHKLTTKYEIVAYVS